MRARHVLDLQGANLERVDPAHLQPSQPNLPDARAQRVDQWNDALAFRGLLRDDRHLGARVEHEGHLPTAVHAPGHHHLVANQLEGHGVHGTAGCFGHRKWRARAEAPQEADVLPRPDRLVAPVLFGSRLT